MKESGESLFLRKLVLGIQASTEFTMVVAKWHVRKDVWGAEGISGRVKFNPLI
jgi:hypothetical protein